VRQIPQLVICALFVAVSSTQFASGTEQPPNIVVFGDSLVAGYQLPPGAGFPDRLQVALEEAGVAAKIVGAGVSGDTTSGGLSRLAWSVPDGTDAVILELGANDALRGLPPQLSAANLENMVKQLQDRNIKVLLVGMLAPPNMGEDYAAAFNPIYANLSEKFQLPLYPFFLDGVMTVEGMTLPDGMHPSPEGVDVMVAGILPLVERLIEELRPTP
jgi:acyl-CoA thioesterase-1